MPKMHQCNPGEVSAQAASSCTACPAGKFTTPLGTCQDNVSVYMRVCSVCLYVCLSFCGKRMCSFWKFTTPLGTCQDNVSMSICICSVCLSALQQSVLHMSACEYSNTVIVGQQFITYIPKHMHTCIAHRRFILEYTHTHTHT